MPTNSDDIYDNHHPIIIDCLQLIRREPLPKIHILEEIDAALSEDHRDAQAEQQSGDLQ